MMHTPSLLLIAFTVVAHRFLVYATLFHVIAPPSFLFALILPTPAPLHATGRQSRGHGDLAYLGQMAHVALNLE